MRHFSISTPLGTPPFEAQCLCSVVGDRAATIATRPPPLRRKTEPRSLRASGFGAEPRHHRGITQEVGHKQSQRAPKPFTWEALIHEALFVALRARSRIGKSSPRGCTHCRRRVRSDQGCAPPTCPSCLAGAGTRGSPKWSRNVVPSYSRRNNPRA